MGRHSNRKERRLQILTGFRKALARHGYEKATIASIAREAELTSGLIHYHFSNKQELLLELTRQLEETMEARYHSFLREGSTAAHKLAAFLDAHLSLGSGEDKEAVACWVTIGTEALRQKELAQCYQQLTERRRARLITWLREFSVFPDIEQQAAAILAAIEGCYQFAAACPQIAPSGFAAPTVRRMVEGLVGVALPQRMES